MNKILELSLLYDFYGSLLTERQQQIFEFINQHDLSLAEASEELSISRQGVRSIYKATISTLEKYEEKLKLVEKFFYQTKQFETLTSVLKDMSFEYKENSKIIESLKQISQLSALIYKPDIP